MTEQRFVCHSQAATATAINRGIHTHQMYSCYLHSTLPAHLTLQILHKMQIKTNQTHSESSLNASTASHPHTQQKVKWARYKWTGKRVQLLCRGRERVPVWVCKTLQPRRAKKNLTNYKQHKLYNFLCNLIIGKK